MFSHKSLLIIGEITAADIVSIVKNGGYELSNCEYSFEQGYDNSGKARTKVFGGMFNLTIPTLPSPQIIEWALDSRKYQDGAIIILDAEEFTQEKIFFRNAACLNLNINYTQAGESYISTKIVVQAESILFDNGVDFDNEWVK